ncbi:MAG: DUF3073 domain-containing protein [Bifidobacteriaceae bacterium]|jgi:hypothetical protein|nr:DUF3073 domain-containing protein [Bifidobacteriaceae bacterium]
MPTEGYEGVTYMGRGRQKAKQTKVARKLKYYTPETDYRALERELSGDAGGGARDDPYAEYAARYAPEDEDSEDPDADAGGS